MDMNNGRGLPEGVGGTGWRRAKGRNQDNSNSIINYNLKKLTTKLW